MNLPSSKVLRLPPKSYVRALWLALRFLRADRHPVYVGDIATFANRKARQWGLKREMEASWQRYLREGHINSIADRLPVRLEVVCGKKGIGKGKVMIREAA